jgi:hypothetical protein
MVRGRVERCAIRIRGNEISIPLSPAIVPNCPKNRLTLKLTFTDTTESCLNKRGMMKKFVKKLKSHYQGATLDILVEEDKIHCKTITLSPGDVALIFKSDRMDRSLIQASIGD